MYVTTSIIPDPGEEPRAYLGGTSSDIPIVDLVTGETRVSLQFDDTEVKYLDALALSVMRLVQDIRGAEQVVRVEPQPQRGLHGVTESDLDAWAGDHLPTGGAS
jgi:hypothetical protein